MGSISLYMPSKEPTNSLGEPFVFTCVSMQEGSRGTGKSFRGFPCMEQSKRSQPSRAVCAGIPLIPPLPFPWGLQESLWTPISQRSCFYLGSMAQSQGDLWPESL